MSIDFDKIRRDYPLPEIAAQSGLKLDKDGNEFRACCPFHSEKSASFTIYRPAQSSHFKYHCFGCGAHGDVIDFVSERYGYNDAGEAARHLTGDTTREPMPIHQYREATNAYDGYDIIRPPQDTPPIYAKEKTPPILNPKRVDPKTGKPKVVIYKPSMVFPYRNKFGELIGYVLRVDIDGKKITPGVWWTRNKAAGFTGWSHGSFPAPRPLYGLDQLHANPQHQVLIVEGEKCKDAAERLMQGKGVTAVSWMGGGKSLDKVHWASLKNRSVIIWPDNDAEGWKTAMGWPDDHGNWHDGIVGRLFAIGVTRIKIIHITRDSRPNGWDIADAEAEGLDGRAVELIMRDRIQAWPRKRYEEWKAGRIAGAKVKEQERDRPNADADNSNIHSVDNEPHPEQDNPENALDDGKARRVDKKNGATSQSGHTNEVGRGYQITSEDWRSHLIYKADGTGIKGNSLQNAALMLQYESRFAGTFAWNEFAKEVYLQRRPPWDISGIHGHWIPRKMTEPDVTSAACWLEYCGLSPKANDVGKVIQRVAQHNAYNPVTSRLTELHWDGVTRLSGGEDTECWLSHYLGAAPSPANTAFGRKWMIGAVARAFQPGCKVDTMLVLEGEQGLKKSTALRIISDAVIPGIFTDEISDPNSKDAGLQMQGALIIEIAELDAFRRAEISQIKSWLSRQTDRFRRPYGKIIEEFPRSCIFAGTVNPIGLGYLKDPSGGRRFWPVPVTSIDLDRLKKDAPQLWAEAVAAYQDGEKWWLEGDEIENAAKVQAERYEEDPFSELINNYLMTRTQVSTMDILANALEIPKERRTAIVLRRVTSHLHAMGWIRSTSKTGAAMFSRPDRMI